MICEALIVGLGVNSNLACLLLHVVCAASLSEARCNRIPVVLSRFIGGE